LVVFGVFLHIFDDFGAFSVLAKPRFLRFDDFFTEYDGRKVKKSPRNAKKRFEKMLLR